MRTKSLARRPIKNSRLSPSATAPTDHNINALREDSSNTMAVEILSENDGGEDYMGSDSSDDEFIYSCLKCNNGDNLLMCCGDGCAICLHRHCIPCGPKYEDGNFYCPYCWYKLHQARTQEWKTKILSAKSSLRKFMDLDPVEVEKHSDGKGNVGNSNVGPVMEEAVTYCMHLDRTDVDDDVRKGTEEVEKDHQNDENVKISDDDPRTVSTEPEKISETRELEDLDDKVMEQGQGNEQVADKVVILGGEEQELVDGHHAEKDTIHEGWLHGSAAEVESKSLNLSKGNQAREDNEEQMHVDAPAANNVTVAVRQETNENAVVHEKTSVHSHNTSAKDGRDRMEESISLEKSRQSKDSDKMLMNAPFSKHKRIRWTPEEEDMLREGVHNFSSKVNKNLPWRKILDFGRHIFDKSRTPSDLKDKWRKVGAKTG
ncbi:uncharacterized protein LOC126664214 [Mercurialis annua]|uniref:uncharacterized protein LOC126664214 n=1 Tax=Mercurialis annua TaxID=3986 RepID=UPI00215EFD55|nr:uncharacterized protein LOC126664214 [Mercurialis annua]